MTSTPTPNRRAAAVALVLSLSLLAPAAPASSERFDQARAAFDEASASATTDPMHEGYVRAYAIWDELAEEGDTRSLYHLGIMNQFGLGGAEFDQYLAVRRVRASADAGYPMAQSYMGFLVENAQPGLVVETGDEAALSWWRKGAEGNHCAAVRRMARAYREGELGLAPDAAKANAWAAREQGCTRN